MNAGLHNVLDDQITPPRRSVNLVINAMMQPFAAPLWWLSASGVESVKQVTPFGWMLLTGLYVGGMSMVYSAVCARNRRMATGLAFTFLIVNVPAVVVGMIVLAGGITSWSSILKRENLLAFLPMVYFAWSSITFILWSDDLDRWERIRLTCDTCGYNLIGSLHDGQTACPECGCDIRDEIIQRYERARPSPKLNR